MRAEYDRATLYVAVGAGDHAQGSDDALVTLVEYGDYECPHCGRAYPIVQTVQRHFGDDLRFVFRNFPLSQFHPHAQHAAEAAEAAAQQAQFWAMHDTLFEHQEALEDRDLAGYADIMGIDGRRLEQELVTGVHRRRVRQDFAGGVKSGVNGTPTFFIDGDRYDGAWDPRSLIAAIESRRRGRTAIAE